jgi:Ser/Thr protein kinase RdoA (MazF antagonist)
MNWIQGEVDWLNYLAAGGVSVARAIHSNAGHLIEALDDGQGEQFLATAFVKAPGGHHPRTDWTPEFMQHYGETLGRIHRLSRAYQPTNPAWKRLHWNDPIGIDLKQWKHHAETPIVEKAHTIMQHLNALPHDETYHMIHQDAHGGNFYVDEGHITLFDFDDCCYGHAIYDVAMVIFYSVPKDDTAVAFTKRFAPQFLTGYAREYKLDPDWLAEIPYFLKLREIDLYVMIQRDFDWRNDGDEWNYTYMFGRQERLLNDEPYLDFDFTKLAHLL